MIMNSRSSMTTRLGTSKGSFNHTSVNYAFVGFGKTLATIEEFEEFAKVEVVQ